MEELRTRALQDGGEALPGLVQARRPAWPAGSNIQACASTLPETSSKS